MNKLRKFLILILIIFSFQFLLTSEIEFNNQTDLTLTDGPHIFYNQGHYIIHEITDGNLEIDTLRNSNEYYIKSIGQTVTLKRSFQNRGVSDEDFKLEEENYLVISDIHGQFQLMRTILINNGIIDNNNNWLWNDRTMVVAGDVFDRGPQVTEILWLIYSLQEQADNVGGNVILTLGNHEMMIFQQDLRYVNSKYDQICDLLGKSYSDLYSKNSVIGNWLHSQPTAVQINKNLIVHAGISPELNELYHSLQLINFDVNRLLHGATDIKNSEIILHSKGPFWYRGYFNEINEKGFLSEDQIDTILTDWDIDKIIVGHTTNEHVSKLYNGKIIAVDSGIKRGKSGEVLLIEKEKYYIINELGVKSPLGE